MKRLDQAITQLVDRNRTENQTAETDSDSESDLDFSGFFDPDSEPENLDMAYQIPIVNKFVGRIMDPNDPDKQVLEAYHVHQFLADVDARIVSRRITAEAEKIKEAHLFVSQDKGDARVMLANPIFSDLTTYDQFKAKCISVWQPVEYQDKFYNLLQLRESARYGTDVFFLSELRKTVDRITQDIKDNPHITKHAGGKTDQLVEIHDISSYFSYGQMYAVMHEDFRKAFRKVQLNPSKDHLQILGEIKVNMAEEKVKSAADYVFHSPAKFNKEMQKMGKPQACIGIKREDSSQQYGHYGQGQHQNRYQQGQHSHQNPSNYYHQGQDSNVGQYRYDDYYGSYQGYQSGGYRGGRGRGYGRGRNYKSQGDRNRIECKKCGRNNHKTEECTCCDYCGRPGHHISECKTKQRDKDSTRGQNKTRGYSQGHSQSENKGQDK